MTGQEDTLDLPQALSRLAGLKSELNDVGQRIDALQSQYMRAGGELRERAGADVESIHQLREEAERLVRLIQGGSLFGRYAADADMHARSARGWSAVALMALLVATAIESVLAIRYPTLSAVQLLAPALPLVLLFTYASFESSNHRSREQDRRRIYLRIAAIETYTQRSNITDAERLALDELFTKFIERHFIEPDLDSNDMTVVGARGVGPWRAVLRRRSRQSGSEVKPVE